jgi:hypothetical protein
LKFSPVSEPLCLDGVMRGDVLLATSFMFIVSLVDSIMMRFFKGTDGKQTEKTKNRFNQTFNQNLIEECLSVSKT